MSARHNSEDSSSSSSSSCSYSHDWNYSLALCENACVLLFFILSLSFSCFCSERVANATQMNSTHRIAPICIAHKQAIIQQQKPQQEKSCKQIWVGSSTKLLILGCNNYSFLFHKTQCSLVCSLFARVSYFCCCCWWWWRWWWCSSTSLMLINNGKLNLWLANSTRV